MLVAKLMQDAGGTACGILTKNYRLFPVRKLRGNRNEIGR